MAVKKNLSIKQKLSQTKPKRATSKREAVKSRRLKIVPVIVFLLVALATGVAYSIHHNRQQNLEATRQKIESYLEEKYRRQFVVGTPERKANGFGVEGYEESVVYPRGDESLRFTAATASTGSSDTYVIALWRRDEAPRIEAKLMEVYGEVPEYELTITIDTKALKDIRTTPPPSFDEARQLYPDTLLYNLSIKVDKIDKKDELFLAHKLYEINGYIASKSLGEYSISYYMQTGEKERYGFGGSSDYFKAVINPEQLKLKHWRTT